MEMKNTLTQIKSGYEIYWNKIFRIEQDCYNVDLWSSGQRYQWWLATCTIKLIRAVGWGLGSNPQGSALLQASFKILQQCLLLEFVFIGHWLTGKKSYQSFWKIIGQYRFLWPHQRKIYRSLTDFKLKLSVISDFNRSLTDDRALK